MTSDHDIPGSPDPAQAGLHPPVHRPGRVHDTLPPQYSILLPQLCTWWPVQSGCSPVSSSGPGWPRRSVSMSCRLSVPRIATTRLHSKHSASEKDTKGELFYHTCALFDPLRERMEFPLSCCCCQTSEYPRLEDPTTQYTVVTKHTPEHNTSMAWMAARLGMSQPSPVRPGRG